MHTITSNTKSAFWYVYVIKCSDDTLYTGTTNNVAARMHAHNSRTGAKYTQGRAPVSLIHLEQYPDRSTACKREAAIKRLRKIEKKLLHNQVE